ncbi:BamA/TamA family outer membrane protein [Shewanella electrodiphila]|uniref:BamA/TamA family outer membrane protein n=1 Tax=Shewanella electrodiphila TaxID=934143 RepID=A0ABT0KJ28_9GAMM|nr:BamA/TamA family outer membrane protein [Shewanella electrodiphila]MCL1043837.1 BamA/TamA family outer membrane protein [Shewanella electrodiphila]
MFKFVSLCFLSLVSSVGNAESSYFFDEKDGQFDLGYHLAENAYGFLPVPVLITEPAVGAGGGIVGLFLHETEAEKEARRQKALESIDGGAQLMPAAMTLVGAGGTANGTWFGIAGHRHSWLDDSIRYTVVGGAANANLDIYTRLGGLLPPDKAIQFDTTTEALFALQKIQFRVAETPLMLGLKQFWAESSVSSSNAVVDWILQQQLGDKTTTSGLGLIAEYDTRDNIFFPKKGYIFSAEYMVFDESIGSDHNYQTLEASGEVYLPLSNHWTLAFAGGYDQLYAGDIQLSPTTKPYVELRGVSAFKYQGDQVATVQSQLMYHLNHRWTLSAFYGYGVTDSDAIEENSDSVDSYGVGFRYQIARRYGIHMGMDFATSGDENAVYFTLGSGF